MFPLKFHLDSEKAIFLVHGSWIMCEWGIPSASGTQTHIFKSPFPMTFARVQVSL